MSIPKVIDKAGRIKLTVFFKEGDKEVPFHKWFYTDTLTAFEKYVTWLDDHMENISDYNVIFTYKLAA